MLGAIAIIIMASLVAFFTILSVSAISTNGKLSGGGLYFMISRSLGCEFGGSIGIIFYLANIAGAAMYMAGFAETIIDTAGVSIADDNYLTTLILASSVLFVLFIVAIAGAEWFSKGTLFFFVPLVLSIVAAIFSLLLSPEGKVDGFTGPDFGTLGDQLMPKFSEVLDSDDKPTGKMYNMRAIFSVFFPAVTGVMAGANMSGDLKNPAKAIPRGTMGAFITAVITYIGLAILLGLTVMRETLQQNMLVMQNVCFFPPLITVGICCSTLSSALGAIVGSSRILKAIAEDKMLPGISFFAKGNGAADEPRRAVVFGWLLVQAMLFTGSLDTLANIVTMFFLLSYSVVNLATFVLKVSGAPNFRPLFPYFSWWTGLIGAVLCVGTMFVVDPIYASAAVIIFFATFVAIHFMAPPNTWGDISQALIYHQVRKYLLRLDVRKEHVKYWRPQLLVLVDQPRMVGTLNMMDFANNLKKGGLYVLGNVLLGSFSERKETLRLQEGAFRDFLNGSSLKAFFEVVVASSFRIGAQTLMLTAGVGAMRPNTVVLGFFRSSSSEPISAMDRKSQGVYSAFGANPLLNNFVAAEDLAKHVDVTEYFQVIADAMYLEKNVMICRNFETLNKHLIIGFHEASRHGGAQTSGQPGRMRIDVVLSIDDDGSWDRDSATCSILLQFGYIVRQTDVWKKHSQLRILTVVQNMDKAANEIERLQEFLLDARIVAAVEVLVLDQLDLPVYADLVKTRGVGGRAEPGFFVAQPRADRFRVVNEALKHVCAHTGVVFLPLPGMPTSESSYPEYGNDLEVLTESLPPTLLVYGRQTVVNTSY